MFMMRFDMRAPEFGGSTTDLYKAAIDMAEWAETRGCMAAVISEHHTSSDGYIPSPLLLASAMAARTNQLHISIAAARYQAARVARVRGLDAAAVQSLIDAHAHTRLLGFLGEPRVNVLELNLALDALEPHNAPPGA